MPMVRRANMELSIAASHGNRKALPGRPMAFKEAALGAYRRKGQLLCGHPSNDRIGRVRAFGISAGG
jgi:hypothetical protein